MAQLKRPLVDPNRPLQATAYELAGAVDLKTPRRDVLVDLLHIFVHKTLVRGQPRRLLGAADCVEMAVEF
jgi:hypothetical protein